MVFNALLNLAINACDAMGDAGGTLILATSNTVARGATLLVGQPEGDVLSPSPPPMHLRIEALDAPISDGFQVLGEQKRR